jgi:hypothetical protein
MDIDLGYYWGDEAPVPVLLTTASQGNQLTVRVENRTSSTATGGKIEIQLPDSLAASADPFSSQATLESSRKGLLAFEVEDMPAGESAVVSIPLTEKIAAASVPGLPQSPTQSYQAATESIQIVFTYDQQLTPQRLAVDPAAQPDASASVVVSPPQADAPQEGMMSVQEADAQPLESGSPDTGAQGGTAGDAESSMLPVTGKKPLGNLLAVSLPVLLVLGLGAAGYRALVLRR